MTTLTIEQHDFIPLEPIPVPIPTLPLPVPSLNNTSSLSHDPPLPHAQPVFEATRLVPMRRGQRIAVTVLLLVANIVQVSKKSLDDVVFLIDDETGVLYYIAEL